MSNRLKKETSPYLLQHAENPVDWYPWGEEAFMRAEREDKPVFLSIGYSTCHWCHVMAHESFEDKDTADILNKYFISIKVDKEERPDIDSIYMSVCRAFCGSGGWPMSIFMTPGQKPFFAGTYFPVTSGYGQPGFRDLLMLIHERWTTHKEELLNSAESVVEALSKNPVGKEADFDLIEAAKSMFKRSFDKIYGGFGTAPKFPTPHNILFLISQFEKNSDTECLKMAEKTLINMYRGGLFDHIGGGFSRYSTDDYFLVPHFEKMLYDNALLILAYCRAFSAVKNPLYKKAAQRTADYILTEMTSPEGGFYSAQDADSDGEEGKYYLFEPNEIIGLLGEKSGKEFNAHFDITCEGNFEGKNIPNLLKNKEADKEFAEEINNVYKYRRSRSMPHTDDKILTSWNSLMIAALCNLYRISKNKRYSEAASRAEEFIEKKLSTDKTLFVGIRNGVRKDKGFLDDYANYIFALLNLYDASLNMGYLKKARDFADIAVGLFFDTAHGGFYFYSKEHERLILRPKESYDGAIPSGNSVMAYNLVRLFQLTDDNSLEDVLKKHMSFMSAEAAKYPMGYAFFLYALSDFEDEPQKIIAVIKDKEDLKNIPFKAPPGSLVKTLVCPKEGYSLKDGKTTFYICKGRICMPPVNEL